MAITYSIDGGADAAKFNINSTSGALTFKTAPDFEAPGDANQDNVYEVSVKATDAGGAASSKLVKVTVTDVSENAPPQITSSGAVSVKEGSTTVMTVTATDPDDGGTTPPVQPPSTGWADASNTGIQPGITLTPFNGVKTITNSTPVENLLINGFIKLATNGAVIRNCKIVMNGTSYAGVIDCYNGGQGGSGHLIEHCVIDGNNNNSRGNGVVGIGGIVNTEVRFCHIVRCVDGISTGHGTNNSKIHDNFISHFDGTGSDPHNDGMVIEATNGCTVRHNTIYNQLNQSSCIDCSEYLGNTSNITFDNNLFYGPTMVPKNFHIHQRNGNSINWASMVVTNNYWGSYEIDGTPGTMSGNSTNIKPIMDTLDLSMPD